MSQFTDPSTLSVRKLRARARELELQLAQRVQDQIMARLEDEQRAQEADRAMFGRLASSAERSYRALKPFRDLNRVLVTEYAGPTYGQEQMAKKEKHLNMLNQAVDDYQVLLSSNRPTVSIQTHKEQYRAFARHYQEAVNNLLKEIGFELTVRQWIMDAFFCIGVVKLHMANAGLVEIEQDIWMDPGSPFCSNVSIDNFVFDMNARKFSEIKYAGDMYRIPFEDLKDESIYDQDVVKDLTPNSKFSCDSERLERISRGVETDYDELEPMIDLIDIWIKRTNMIYTFAVDRKTECQIKGKPVARMNWRGSEHGPYAILAFADVPENIMPTSPASHLYPLDQLINNLMRKNSRQARRQKDVHTYTPAGAPAAKRIQRADDGDWIEVQDTNEIGTVKQGGVDVNNHAFMVGTLQLFNSQAGNLQALMGRGAQTPTVGQEKLVHEASNRKIAKMQSRVAEAVIRVVRDLGLMLWQDEFKEIVGQIQIGGAPGYSVQADWKPGDREGNFFDYNFEIDVYSMQHQSPSDKIEQVNFLISNIYAPLAQMLLQQGGAIDMFGLTKVYSDLMRLPQLKDIVVFRGMAQEQDPAMLELSGGKAPSTTRNYVRHNISAASDDLALNATAQIGFSTATEWQNRTTDL